MNWIKDNKEEWTNTKMIFDTASKGGKTILYFTHQGLTPEKECYAMCKKGWTMIITDWLFHFISFGTPSKEIGKASEIRNSLLEKMENKNFTATIEVRKSAQEVCKGICNINEWWGHIEGSTEKLNDVFTYRPNNTWVKFKITACNDQRIAWHVTDCFLHFQNDKTEWTNTDVVFEIIERENSTQINFTHVGLVPEVECYNACSGGWTHYIKVSLLQFLTTGKGQLK